MALVGDPAFASAWGPLVSVTATETARVDRSDAPIVDLLRGIADRWAERRRGSGHAGNGIALMLGFELGVSRDTCSGGPGLPDLVAWEVDAALRWTARGVRYESRPDIAAPDVRDVLRTVRARAGDAGDAARSGTPSTSLPREAYLTAVATVRERILEGDIYQANLTQTFRVDDVGDRLDVFDRLLRATPAPRAAFVESGDFALASVSPEVFVDVGRAGEVETRPIKGTRPRGLDAIADRAAAAELLVSAKDRAELAMIVDLERNDLGRVCRTGSVEVPEPSALRAFPAVHHLEARVTGRLRPDVGLPEWVSATFPGGSISGAPKRRALEILRELEPWRRGWYTGSLLWLGDDGAARSSILIRSVVLQGGRAWLGAGGGVVARSEPLAEWHESNAKARALAAAIGFRPEDAR